MKDTGKTVGIVILCVAVIGIGIYAYRLNGDNSNYKNNIENSSESSYLQLKNSASELSEELGICAISNDNDYLIRTLASVSTISSEAAGRLSAMNISHNVSSSAVAFYMESADYTQSLMLSLAQGGELTDENREVLAAMAKSAQALSEGFNTFYDGRDSENFSWYEKGLSYLSDNVEEDKYAGVFKGFNESQEDYPELKYDGAYAAKGDFEAKGLTGDEMEYGDVQSGIQEKLTGYEDAQLSYTGEVGSDIGAYGFEITQGENTYSMRYSKQGGSLISASSSKMPQETKIEREEAEEAAKEFLTSLGISDIEVTNWNIYSNSVLFNFVYVKDGIKYYSDKLSVQMSLEDASVLAYEATGYYTNHHDRELAEATMTAEEAQKSLSDIVEVKNVAKAIVMSSGGTEVMCYEFEVSLNDMTYVILVDANSGKELDIYRKSEDENGVIIY